MTSLFRTVPTGTSVPRTRTGPVDPFRSALAVLALLLVVAGVVAAAVGLHAIGEYRGAVLGLDGPFDDAVTTAIVGGAAIALGLAVGVVWLVLASLDWQRTDRGARAADDQPV